MKLCLAHLKYFVSIRGLDTEQLQYKVGTAPMHMERDGLTADFLVYIPIDMDACSFLHNHVEFFAVDGC